MSSIYSVQLGYSFNINLGKNLELFRNAVLNQDFDLCLLVDGPEGSGKSVFAQQIAKFLDVERKVEIKQICFTPDEVQKRIRELSPGKAIVWDEARRGANRRRSMQEVNLQMTDLLAESRQRNLFLVVVMPSFYDMDMNIAVWRSRVLIHVWYEMDMTDREQPLRRGFFRFYNEEGKKALYTDRALRQGYRYPHLPNQSFDATFPHVYVVSERLYREKKAKSMQKTPKNMELPLVAKVVEMLKSFGIVFPDGYREKIAAGMGLKFSSVVTELGTAKRELATLVSEGENEEVTNNG